MKTKIIILGSGNSFGVPTLDGNWGNCNEKNKKNFRTRCSAFIIKGNNKILIDTSPDIREQFLKNKITDVSSVLYTHQHSDQTNGIFELRPFFYKYKRKINIYGNQTTVKSLKKRFSFCFYKSHFYPPIVQANLIKKNFSLGTSNEKINFKTFQAKHGFVKTTAYIFEKTLYLSDCNDLSIVKRNDLKNLNCLIIDCLKVEKNFAHYNLQECLYIHKKLSPKKTILTNLHYFLDYNWLLKKLPKNIFPAYDGLKINL